MKKIIVGLFVIIQIQFLNSANILNQPLLKYKQIAFKDGTYPNTLYDMEFLTNEKIIYSTNMGLYLFDMATNETKTLIAFRNEIIDGKWIKKDTQWGQIGNITRINDYEFYFGSHGIYKANLKINEMTYLGKMQIPKLYQPEGFKLEDYGKTSLYDDGLRDPFFDPLGKYFFAVDVYKSFDKGPLVRIELKTKKKKKLITRVLDDHEKFVIANQFILTETMHNSSMVLADYNGNVLQWYTNFIYMYGAISPDNKYAAFNCGVYNKDTRYVSQFVDKSIKAELSVKYMGLVLFEIDQVVLKALQNYSKSLEGVKDKIRLKRGKVFEDFHKLEKYKLEGKMFIEDSIYRVIM